jgi:hypothetical protein
LDVHGPVAKDVDHAFRRHKAKRQALATMSIPTHHASISVDPAKLQRYLVEKRVVFRAAKKALQGHELLRVL